MKENLPSGSNKISCLSYISLHPLDDNGCNVINVIRVDTFEEFVTLITRTNVQPVASERVSSHCKIVEKNEGSP